MREPTLSDEDGSLYTFLNNNGGQSTIQKLNISRLAAPSMRTYEGGVEQAFLGEHVVFRASYFHNEFGREIEFVGLDLVPQLLPNLTPAQQQQLESILQQNFAYELAINSEAFRAQGIESTVEGGIGRNIFLRGGYTYLDAVVQRSFTNDDQALLGPIPTFTNGIPIGPYSPLQGARPFRRPPHTGFFTATYSANKLTGIFTSAFTSHSDDSTFLEGDDIHGGNSLLLPNRNLDHGFVKTRPGRQLPVSNVDGDLRAGRKSAQRPAHRPHRLSQPAHELPHRAALSVGAGRRPLMQAPAIDAQSQEADFRRVSDCPGCACACVLIRAILPSIDTKLRADGRFRT